MSNAPQSPRPDSSRPDTAQINTIILRAPKSHGIGLLLTFLLGPIGLLYATTLGGLILAPLAFIIGIFTFGLGALLTWPVAIVWSILAISLHNRKLNRETTPAPSGQP